MYIGSVFPGVFSWGWGSFENYELVDILGPSGIYDAGLIIEVSNEGYPVE